MHLPSVGHISARKSSSDTPCQRSSKFKPYLHISLPRQMPLHCTMYRTTCRYLSAPTKVGPDIVNDNVLGCLGTVLICSLRLSVTKENLGDHAHWRLWVESQRAGDVENTVSCNLQYAMPNVARIRLLTHVNTTPLTK